MASIKEIDNTLSPYFTLSNKNLIIIAHVREECVYFYEYLGPNTTIILLAEPKNKYIKKIFLELMIEMGVTVIDLCEKESFDDKYMMSKKSIDVIKSLLRDNKYQRIITHQKYKISSDPQNRAIYDLVNQYVKNNKLNNHFTYDKNINNVCDIRKNIFELYCTVSTDDGLLDENMYNNYIAIASNIKGLKKV